MENSKVATFVRLNGYVGSSPTPSAMQQIMTLPVWTGKQYLSVLVVPGPSGQFNDTLTRLYTVGSYN